MVAESGKNNASEVLQGNGNAADNTVSSACAPVPSDYVAFDKPRSMIYSLLLGLAIAITTAGAMVHAGVSKITQHFPFMTKPIMVVVLIAVFVVVSALSYLVLKKTPAVIQRARCSNPFPKLAIRWDKKSILVCTIIIFLFWLPWIILQYPAAINNDTYNQFYQFQTSAPTFYTTMGYYVDAEFVDHHPVFDTLLFGAFLSLGNALGSQNMGLFIYSLLQSMFTAIALAASCCYLDRLGVPKIFRLLSLAFVALFFPLAFFATTMVKDSLFSMIFVFTFLMYLEVFITKGDALRSNKFLVGFIVLAGLCILTKKTGSFILVPSLFLLLLVCRKEWKRVLAAAVTPFVVFSVLIPAIANPLLNVAPGGSQEMMGSMYQQVVTVLRSQKNDVTEEELQAVEKVLHVDKAKEKYKRSLVDGVKNRAVVDATLQDQLDFIGAYLSIGVRHPLLYAYSIASANGADLGPGVSIDLYTTDELKKSWTEQFNGFENSDTLNITISKPEPFKSAAASFDDAYSSAASGNIFFALFFGKGFYGGWLPIICILIAASNNRRNWIAYMPIILTVLAIIVGPGSMVRYIYPLVYTVPLMLGMLCGSFYKELPVKETDRLIAISDEEMQTEKQRGTADVTSTPADTPLWLVARNILKDDWGWRKQIFRLAFFELKKRARGAAFGWAWLVIKPVVYIIVFWFALEVGLRAGDADATYPYFVWLVSGLIPWFFMSDMINTGTDVLHRYSYLVNKVKFPLSSISVLYTLSTLYINIVLFIALLVIYAAYGMPWDIYMIQVPILLVLMFFFWNAFSVLTSELSGISKDFGQLMKAFNQPCFWLSGILFDMAVLEPAGFGWAANIMLFNPITFFCTAFRDATCYKIWFWQDPVFFGCFILVFVVIVLAALLVYRHFNEEVSDVL